MNLSTPDILRLVSGILSLVAAALDKTGSNRPDDE